MTTRGFFLILVMLNLAIFGWIMLQPEKAAYHLLPAKEAQTPSLVLLSEFEAQNGISETPAVIAEHTDTDALQCFSIGPLPSKADVRKLIKGLSNQIYNAKQREEMTTQDLGYWVYLPAVASRDVALKQARSLSELGVRDYYVVTAGDRENTVSLGLFRQKENAVRRKQYIESLDFDAKMTVRKQELPVYYLDYAIKAGNPVDLSQLTENLRVKVIERSCN
ncbi:MAG: SPOR domain-containing protein [bacterium]